MCVKKKKKRHLNTRDQKLHSANDLKISLNDWILCNSFYLITFHISIIIHFAFALFQILIYIFLNFNWHHKSFSKSSLYSKLCFIFKISIFPHFYDIAVIVIKISTTSLNFKTSIGLTEVLVLLLPPRSPEMTQDLYLLLCMHNKGSLADKSMSLSQCRQLVKHAQWTLTSSPYL